MSLIQSLNLVLTLLLLAISSSLVLVTVVTWNRSLVSRLLLGLSSMSCVLALNGLAEVLQDPRIDLEAIDAHRISATLIMIAGGICYFLMKQISEGSRERDERIQHAVPIVIVVAIIYVWIGNGIEVSSDGGGVESSWGLFVAVIALALLMIARGRDAVRGGGQFVEVFSAAGLLLVSALAVVIIIPNERLLLEIALVAIVNGLAGWSLVQVRFLQPSVAFRAEIEQRRRDTARLVAELATVKADRMELIKSLELASRYRNEFLSNMSHELRTPLNSIIGYSELLRNRTYGELNEKQADRVERIHRNGSQLLDIITNILDLNQLDGGILELQVAAFSLPEVISGVAERYADKCKTKGIKFEISLSSELPHVFGDRVRITTLIENLVDNAAKFTEEGEIRVLAQGIKVSDGNCGEFQLPTVGWLRDGDWVLIRVIDTGIGIAPEVQAYIFDEFTQVETGQTRPRSGTGVGLAIAKKLAELHSGLIWVKSKPGNGSEFFVALPADSLE